LGASLCLVETDALQLPASAREREAPLLHRIKKDIIRCLKRYAAREIYPHLRAAAR